MSKEKWRDFFLLLLVQNLFFDWGNSVTLGLVWSLVHSHIWTVWTSADSSREEDHFVHFAPPARLTGLLMVDAPHAAAYWRGCTLTGKPNG